MGLLDKLKNLFTDEEEIIETQEIEVEEEPKVEEPPKLPTFMREKIEKEEKQINILEEKAKEEEKFSDRELVKPNNSFKFPVAFEEKDFEVPSYNPQNVMQKVKEKEKEKKKSVSELYTKKEDKKKEKHVFKATPIISPVYGILDKNYKKEELKAKKESEYELKRPSKKVDFESVRMKAFGTLADELQDNLLDDLSDVKEASNVEVYHDEELLSDIIEEPKKEDTTIGTAEENYYDFGVAYEVPKENDKDEEASDVKIINHNDEDVVAEKIEVKEENNNKETKKSSNTEDMELTDDLFDLIDSMYEEREDL